MTLGTSKTLVIDAFQNAHPGDIFAQKSPASTIQILADALPQMRTSGFGQFCDLAGEFIRQGLALLILKVYGRPQCQISL